MNDVEHFDSLRLSHRLQQRKNVRIASATPPVAIQLTEIFIVGRNLQLDPQRKLTPERPDNEPPLLRIFCIVQAQVQVRKIVTLLFLLIGESIASGRFIGIFACMNRNPSG